MNSGVTLELPFPVQPIRGRFAISPRRLVKSLNGLIEDRFPNWSHLRHRDRWERKRARPGFQPFWRTEEPQKEWVEAIESGWFAKDDTVYDLGCGAGESTRWLNRCGFSALGLGSLLDGAQSSPGERAGANPAEGGSGAVAENLKRRFSVPRGRPRRRPKAIPSSLSSGIDL